MDGDWWELNEGGESELRTHVTPQVEFVEKEEKQSNYAKVWMFTARQDLHQCI